MDSIKTFDGEQAMRHVQALVALGNRAPGTRGHRASQAYIRYELERLGRNVVMQEFRAGPLLHETDLVNIVSPSTTPRDTHILVGTHYDTIRLKTGQFVGANDGASGVGVLLELARVLPPGWTVELAFFDGEEALGGAASGLHGSRHYVRNRGHAVTTAIIIDMVGDIHLRLTREQLSTPAVSERLFDIGHQLGYDAMLGGPELMVEDDHLPFLDAGLPAALLIDYGDGQGPGQPPYWHTVHDTVDKVCAASLEAVGHILVRYLQS